MYNHKQCGLLLSAVMIGILDFKCVSHRFSLLVIVIKYHTTKWPFIVKEKRGETNVIQFGVSNAEQLESLE